jgi:carbon-monoxide dehydrogenase medium subunit
MFSKNHSLMQKLFRPKECFRPKSVEEAVSFLDKYDNAKVIAGGTDLLVDKPPEVEYLVDISCLNLRYVTIDEFLRIGALTTIRDLEISPLLKGGPYLAISEAARSFGSLPIRNTATVGGNICNAISSADIPPPLVALDAKVKVVGPREERILPLGEFFVGNRQTLLRKNELLVEVQVPQFPPNTGAAFIKFARTSIDLALVNMAVKITLEGELMKQVRVVVGGGVGPTLIRSKKAEEILENQKINEKILDEAAEAVSAELRPRPTSIRGSGEYKREISKVLLRSAALQAWERARGG